MKLGTILVPVDYSGNSDRARAAATELATRFGAEVHLLHSYGPLDVGSAYGYQISVGVMEDVRRAAEKRMDSEVAEVERLGLKATGSVTQLGPAEAICDAADRLGADLIVMGTHGRTGLKHALLGSVAERTLRTARCPVLTIPARDA